MVYRIVIGLYGLINILGGIFAFTKYGSPMSLTVGGIAGLILVVFAALAGKNPGLAFRGAAVLSLLLSAFWVYRIFELKAVEKPIMMAVMNLCLGLGVFLVLGLGHLMAMKKGGA